MPTVYVGEAWIELSKFPSGVGDKWLLSIAERPESSESCVPLSSAELEQLIDWMQGCVTETVKESEQEDNKEGCYDDGVEVTDEDDNESEIQQ